MSDIPGQAAVQLYCGHCEDVYRPRSSRYSTIDGAYFGTSFPHIFFQQFRHCLPHPHPHAIAAPTGASSNNGGAPSAGMAAGGLTANNVPVAPRKSHDHYIPKIFGFKLYTQPMPTNASV